MEGRHCFAHLTVEENLLTGAFTRRDGQRGDPARPREGLSLFPAPARSAAARIAGYTSGGEQQMSAIGRALMARPKMILLDEPSMGLAPQIVEEIFEIVRDLNAKEGVSFLLAEQNTSMALRYADYGYILENGRVVMDGEAKALRENEDVKEFYLGVADGRRKSFPRRQALPAPQALAGVSCDAVHRSADGALTIALEDRAIAGGAARATSILVLETATCCATADRRAARRDRAAAGRSARSPASDVDPAAIDDSRAALARAAGHAQVRAGRRCRKQHPPFGGFDVTAPGGDAAAAACRRGRSTSRKAAARLLGRGARAVRRRLSRRATSCTTASPITSRRPAS